MELQGSGGGLGERAYFSVTGLRELAAECTELAD
jgi:hypothetical protein